MSHIKKVAHNSHTISMLMCCTLMLVFIAAFFPSALIVDNELGLTSEHILSAIISLLMFLITIVTGLIAFKSYQIAKAANELSERIFTSQREQIESQDFSRLFERFEKRINQIEKQKNVTIYCEGLIQKYLSAGRFVKGKYEPTELELKNAIEMSKPINSFYEEVSDRCKNVKANIPNKSLTKDWINSTFSQLQQIGKTDPIYDSFMSIPDEDLVPIIEGCSIPVKRTNPLYYAEVHRLIISSLLVTMN
ncbi:hypothetical protein RC083_14815 [Pseudoalteromonas haloplanktis]|uniref:Phage abortive infection protein n=1 Tax=Pseudoalteromonas haloplanktis TaxID=228 RepID=A0ABU1BEC5_PSEHA|nr:hypothetical protein [Pseudoalteromonas haloplanktis]MDQ9092853.1 hypothetical protein [Pseudoalteromonas haloplanktis]